MTLERWWDYDLQGTMSNELSRRFEESVNAADIYMHIKELYGAQTRTVRHITIKELKTILMRDEASVHDHGVHMIGLVENVVGLELVIPKEFHNDIVFLSLPFSFDGFVVNFNMNRQESSFEELVNILTTYETTIKKEKHMFF
ncbi:uncharacterized protein [Primulina huaijiensis]|uniref:uncharacterized protein n=1 Tax=Primulina huaijiensis TaxID=1492673 RepID=UPI003CC7900B